MTLKQVKLAVQEILESHAMIRRVMYNTPQEWMFQENQPEYPLCCFWIRSGSLNTGEKNFILSMWFLDLGGKEGEMELDVVSDQLEIGNDIVSLLRQSHVRDWLTDLPVSFETISDALEDYICGVRFDVTLKTVNKYDACSIPFNS